MWQARPRHPRASGDGSLARERRVVIVVTQSLHGRYTHTQSSYSEYWSL